MASDRVLDDFLGSADEFRQTVGQYIQDSGLLERVVRVYEIFQGVKAGSDGHGITFVLKQDDNDSSRIDRYLSNSRPYNGVEHSLNDTDIVEVVSEKRNLDLATIVDSSGMIVRSSVLLPSDTHAYQSRYGIETGIAHFLGFDPENDWPGARTQSALYASEVCGKEVVIITLGETSDLGEKGEINVYYCGDRIYNSAGREVRWEHASKLPVTRRGAANDYSSSEQGNNNNIIRFDAYSGLRSADDDIASIALS